LIRQVALEPELGAHVPNDGDVVDEVRQAGIPGRVVDRDLPGIERRRQPAVVSPDHALLAAEQLLAEERHRNGERGGIDQRGIEAGESCETGDGLRAFEVAQGIATAKRRGVPCGGPRFGLAQRRRQIGLEIGTELPVDERGRGVGGNG
jgi:hypothetical protein